MKALTRWLTSMAGWMAVAVSLSLAILIGFGYRAVSQWQRSEELLAEKRARETVQMLATALTRQMSGVQNAVLPAWWEELSLDPPDDVRNLVAAAFARYPYPESFFAWRLGGREDEMPFYNRSDRPPAWLPAGEVESPFPVSLHVVPPVARTIRGRIEADVSHGRQFAVFELPLAGATYQVVVRLFYQDAYRERLDGIVGFTVNLAWARANYFPEVARQVARIGTGLPVAIVDSRGQLVAGTASSGEGRAIVRRWFPVTFFDPMLAGADGASGTAGFAYESWAVQTGIRDDQSLKAAIAGANRTLLIAALAAVTLFVGLVLTARAARASARVAGMRSEFVSTVTHELKTPVATIRVIGDTIVRRRVTDPVALQEYAQIIVQESKRLTRLIENLLAYARITDVTEGYAFESLDLASAVEDGLQTFRAQLADAGFEVAVDLSADLPAVRADRTALGLLLDNLIDNAIRYSGASRWLEIRAARQPGRTVLLEVRDRGLGIPKEEIGQVTRRFYRGTAATSGGSGLGLAIVRRIVSDHGGRLLIDSEPGRGTTVSVVLPEAE